MKKLFISIVIIFMWFTNASAEISNAKIETLMIHKSLGNLLFIKLENVTHPNSPSCYTNTNWDFVLPLTSSLDEKMYSILVTAWASDALINYTGTGNCNDYPSVESLERIETN